MSDGQVLYVWDLSKAPRESWPTAKKGTDALVEIGREKIITIHYLPAIKPLLKEHVI